MVPKSIPLAALFASSLGLTTACAEADDGLHLPPPGEATVRFDLAEAPMRVGAVPWPSELYRDDAGRIALAGIGNPDDAGPVMTATRELVATRAGFCTTCNLVFEIEGGLSTPSLPNPADEPSLDDAVVLVDIDPDSDEYGRLFRLRWQWEEQAGRLLVRPARGESLGHARRYAAVVTDATLGGDGLPMGPAPLFTALRDGSGESDDWPLAVDVLDPALAELEALGLPAARVRGLAAFTTDDPRAPLRAIRSEIRARPAPTIRVDRVYRGPELDALLGLPSAPRPGVDIEPAAGTEGTRSIRHETTALVVAGRFAAPRFIEGSGTEVGGPSGPPQSPTASHLEDVPFVLMVPRDADLSRLPVVVAHHGFNASRTTGFVLADTAGRAGFAVLAIDAYQHGDRAASARDELHALRGGVSGPDGFAETDTLDVSSRVFGLVAPDPSMVLFPGYSLAAFQQFAADVMSTVYLVAEGDLGPLRTADPSLQGLSFDRDRIAFVGNSMGAVVGTSIVAGEPDVGAAVLDVMPGSIIETLAESGEFRFLSESIFLPRLGVTGPFDEIDRALLFDPTVDLFRWVLEPVDPLALARSLVQERDDGSPPPHLLIQLAGHDEVAAPTAAESVVGAAGVQTDGEARFVALPKVDLPIESPAEHPAAAAYIFPGAMHGMLEVQSQKSQYQDPLDVPLRPGAATVRENPVEAVHAQIETFLSTYAAGGPVMITD
jgi:hypothetical protein